VRRFAIIKLMVKFRGKPKKKQDPHVAGETGKVQSYVSRDSKGWRNILPSRVSAKVLVIALLVLLIVGFAILYNIKRDKTPYGEPVPDTKTYYSNRIQQLESKKPAQNATARQKAEYYDKLAGAYLEVNDFSNVVLYMNKIEQVLPSYFDYHDYILLASYYHELGDKASAGDALDKATLLLPKTDTPSDLPRADLLKMIDKFRKEYTS
jgi:hypothetical protein